MAHYQALNAQLVQTRKLKHDVVNYLETMELLKRQGYSQEAQNCTQRLYDELQKFARLDYCDNPTVNALLYNKLTYAAECGIAIEEVSVSLPAECALADADLISLFANLLDNAIEACQKVEPPDKRMISLIDASRAGYYALTVINSKPAEAVALAGQLPISSKADPTQHGLGSQIVADIAQLYEGVVRYEDEGERYKVVVMLKI